MNETTATTACRICDNEIPREGMKVCDTCLGLNMHASKNDMHASKEVPPAPSINLCQTCGAAIEPYYIGKGLRAKGECRDCYYRRRYGPGWKPGGMTREEKRAKQREYRKNRKNGGNGHDAPADTGPPEVHAEAVATIESIKAGQQEQAIMAKTVSGALAIKGIKHLTIAFVGDDEAMYARLKDTAAKERRSMEQQVLYFLDRVVEA